MLPTNEKALSLAHLATVCFSIVFLAFVADAVYSPQAKSSEPTAASVLFPQSGTKDTRYASDTLWPNNHTQDQQDEHLKAFYDHWKSLYVVKEKDNTYRIAMGKTGSDHGRTTSEAQGYGMIIVAIMAGHDPEAQTIFDGLWQFVEKYPSSGDNRLMAWEVPPGNSNSAFDGDADIAYGLLLAHKQWGEDAYKTGAQKMLEGIHKSTIGPDSHLPKLGDWVSNNGKPWNEYTPRSSDFMLGHFRTFERTLNDGKWAKVVATSSEVISKMQNPTTGLLPDFIVNAQSDKPEPAPPDFLEGPHDGDYYYNACRDPWRIATDALLNRDNTSRTQAQRMASWFKTKTNSVPSAIRDGYLLNGTSFGSPGSSAFISPVGVAAMTLSAEDQAWVNALYAHMRDSSQTCMDRNQECENYYEDTITLLSLITMTGNFWDPSQLSPSK